MNEKPPRELSRPPDPADAATAQPAKRRKPSGRPPLLTAAVQAVIVEAIAAGCHYPVAAAHAGIDHDTLRLWRRRGERGQQPYADFVKALAKAENDWEVSAVKAIHDAGGKDWRAHLELLSRRIPERWARTNREMNPAGIMQAFNITLHLDDPEWDRQWNEQVRQRRLAMIPAVSADDAQAIELDAPSTKV
jgi:hypothetical protein